MYKKLLLAVIIFVSILLRFYNLSSLPPSLTWDEVAWGYNSYSLGVDGKDEFGRFLPYDYLESFGDFKPPMYAYLGVIPVKLFGLNEFATRFPSAFFGVLTVLITYFLVKRIFPNAKKISVFNVQISLAHLAALGLAISPWHILLSRAAFEANVATFFIVLGVWLFLKGIQEKKYFLIFSFVSFVFSMYTFNTSRIVAPLIAFFLVVGFRKSILQNKRIFITACFIAILVLAPSLPFLTSPQAQLRFKEVNIFWNPEEIEVINQEIKNDNNQAWSKILHNRRLMFSVLYMKHYLDNLNLSFLFVKGDGNPKFSVQNMGQMYLVSLPFFMLGLIMLIRKKEGHWWIIPLWLLAGIIPAATARETPHALRIETSLPTFQIITAYGLVWAVLQLNRYKKYAISIAIVLYFINFSYFLHTYLVHYSDFFSSEWQYGYKESIEYVKKNENKYDQIKVTNVLGRPYIYYLFYLRLDPATFRKDAVIERDPFGFVTVKRINKFSFDRDINRNPDKNKKILYINDRYNLPSTARVLKTFKLLNGGTILYAYEI